MTDPTEAQREKKVQQPAGALNVFIVGVLVSLLGLGGSYLLWGGADDAPEPVVTSAPKRSPERERVIGTRENPLPLGAEARISDWNVTLSTPTNATQFFVDKKYPGNPPQEGFDFFFVPITVTYQGEDAARARGIFTVKFVGDDARTYSGDCPSYMDPMNDVEEVYQGGVVEGMECVEVPKDVAGLWTISSGMGRHANKVFFNAR